VLAEDFTWGSCPPEGAEPDDLADTGGASPTVIGVVAAGALLAGAGCCRLARRRSA
jgi:L-aminopeptidase/D-esterase-like protein